MKEDLSNLMKQAQQMQANIQKAQEELAKMRVAGEAGAGMVKVVLSGRYYAHEVRLSDEAMKEDKAMLQDLITAAVNDAVRKIEGQSKGKMSGLMSGLNLPEGFNIPGTE